MSPPKIEQPIVKPSFIIPTPTSPWDIDWVKANKVSIVKDQGECGACYSFTTTGLLESYFLIKSNVSVLLSEQQLIDCTVAYSNSGCDGGNAEFALKYIIDVGLSTEAQYPYTGLVHRFCRRNYGDYRISSFSMANGCNDLRKQLVISPVAVYVNATTWSSYSSGVLDNCKTESTNHAVLLVGYVKDSWYIKNSWGPGWGVNGYIYVDGVNNCGICLYNSPYPTGLPIVPAKK